MTAGPDNARLDRRSLLGQLFLVAIAVLAFLIPSVPGFGGDRDRHGLALLTIPVAAVLLVGYVAYQVRSLRRHHAAHERGETGAAWSLPRALLALAIATGLTAIVSEILVHSLDAFADAAGLSEFFVAIVIVAVVGNAAEHGGAIVIANRGNMELASEIAISSSAQVGLLVAPAVALISFAFTHPLPLAFRWEEVAGMGFAAAFVAFVIRDGRSHRWEGVLLVSIYVALAVWYAFA